MKHAPDSQAWELIGTEIECRARERTRKGVHERDILVLYLRSKGKFVALDAICYRTISQPPSL